MAESAKQSTTEDPEWLITPEMRARIGVESDLSHYEVEKGPIRMYARAVGYRDRIFWDEDYARSQGYRGLVAPPGFFGFRVLTEPDALDAGPSTAVSQTEDGHTLSGLNAGQRFVLDPGAVICAGDKLTAVSKMVSIRQVQTSRGPAIVSENERTFRNQSGEVVARNYGSAMRILVEGDK
jgi:N-terminal half of MaoC dehydratase